MPKIVLCYGFRCPREEVLQDLVGDHILVNVYAECRDMDSDSPANGEQLRSQINRWVQYGRKAILEATEDNCPRIQPDYLILPPHPAAAYMMACRFVCLLTSLPVPIITHIDDDTVSKSQWFVIAGG
jgi:hypothetical protein